MIPIKLIDKYILKEVTILFLIGLIIISIIMLSSFLFELTDLIIIRKVALSSVLKLLIYKLPTIIVRAIPMSVLFATIIGLGRLSKDNEITALRMGSISIYRLILPLIILGLIISGGNYLLNEKVVPFSNKRFQVIMNETVLKSRMPEIKENIFFKGTRNKLFYIGKYNESQSTVKDIVIYELDSKQDYPNIIMANKGRVYKDNKWELNEGYIYKYNNDGNLINKDKFKDITVGFKANINRFADQQSPSEMSIKELKEEIEFLKKIGADPNSLLVEYHLKFAMPFSALIFILVGSILSIKGKNSKGVNILFTIIIIFFYYLLLSLSRSLGRNEVFSPLVAAWLTNFIFIILGAILFYIDNPFRKFKQKIKRVL
ncbi:LptF/LptG family permease [Acetohalobium arabaticum]|uniref:Permease YjgP/YjgQ family protein n=1 Tax=Acetohalobium arabaticum (strain ATCC 49924 / DSM 5501 / Z-7288) TaxID=574087 RepID=D9QQB6_ACEAZ|nr:LptF/LptG family permease [Acetohalobium arabaticum]ADL12707.1 permease YjgP/YjgQ family protein [Acetohalobium arabaticum DSM 5501]